MTNPSYFSAPSQNLGGKMTCQRCRFLNESRAPQNPPLAFGVLMPAAISNLASFDDGPDEIRELLREHPDYDEQQVTEAIRQYQMLPEEAMSQAARPCIRIQSEGSKSCPPSGCLLPDGQIARFPYDLAAWQCDPIQVRPLVMARAILQVMFPGGIIRIQDKLFAYQVGIWKEVNPDTVKRLILDHLGMGATPLQIEKIFKLIMLDVKAEAITPNSDYICFKNGTFNVQTGQMGAHDLAYYLLNLISHDYNPQAVAPAWLAFLDWIFGGDPDKVEKIALLQEWFGYCLTADTRWQLMLILLGSGANGKTVLASILRAMLGESNVSSASLDRFRQAYVRAELDGKLANIAADLPKGRHVADGELKAIISGDSIEVSPKYKPSYGIRPYVKIMACANTLPPSRDDSKGYVRRLLILQFNNVVPPEQRDPQLFERLAAEMPGIITWSVEGLLRQRNRGRLTIPASSEEVLQQYCETISPLWAFAEECLQPSGDRTGFTAKDLYMALHRWCKERGLDAGNIFSMGRGLGDLGFTSRKSSTTIYQVKPKAGFEEYFRPSVIIPETVDSDSHTEEGDQP